MLALQQLGQQLQGFWQVALCEGEVLNGAARFSVKLLDLLAVVLTVSLCSLSAWSVLCLKGHEPYAGVD